MPAKTELPILAPPDRVAWSKWLAAHHADRPGVWLKLAKKDSGAPETLTYAEALEEAIRYGWIDGQKAAHDATHWLQRFTPRSASSKWSQVNRQTAERLIEADRMTPAGLAPVEAAKRDGRWESAYEPQSRATVPEDLQRALNENPTANEFFVTLKGARRYAFLYRLHQTKRPETRAKKIAAYIELLEQGRTLHD
jgi:uncharacterized protein YdeI (YjbR/CyaY-like superfamily)